MPAQGCKLNYQVRTKSGDVFGQLAAACTGGGKFSPTCDLDYQVRTKSGEERLTAACPHWGSQIICYEWIVLSQVRTKSEEVFRQLTAACPHRGSQIISYVLKVLLQYYSVLQSTTPVLLLVLQSTHLQGAKWHSKITKYCPCHAKWLSWLMSVAYETSFTMRGATGITLQPHQILHLPRKMTLMIDVQCAEQQISSSNITKCCACHAKWLASSILVTYETLFTMRGGTGITRQPHQILRLPRKMTLMIDLRHIWNVIYNARSNRHHPPTSPNTTPATQNDSHDWSSSHMKRHLQCAEQQASPSNLTKYYACHAKVHSKI